MRTLCFEMDWIAHLSQSRFYAQNEKLNLFYADPKIPTIINCHSPLLTKMFMKPSRDPLSSKLCSLGLKQTRFTVRSWTLYGTSKEEITPNCFFIIVFFIHKTFFSVQYFYCTLFGTTGFVQIPGDNHSISSSRCNNIIWKKYYNQLLDFFLRP